MRSKFGFLAAALALAGILNCGAQAQTTAISEFNLPAQSLGDSLRAVGRQLDVNVLFDPARVEGMKAPAIKLNGTFGEALTQLLAGSGFTYRFLNEHTVVLSAGDVVGNGTEEPTATVARVGQVRVAQADTAAAASGSANTSEISSEEQQSAQSPEESPQAARLEEIVVTAQRRQERLLDVPLSMSVLGAEELERRGLVSREDYLRSIPSVNVRDNGVGLAEIVIRGAYGDSFRTGPTVGLYFRDVPLSGYAIGGSADIKLIDIQRVEVLRGPQGTLYGSNALSGAVRYIPVEPDLQDLSGSVRLGYSHTARNGGANNAIDGVLNLPLISDKLALRAVAFRHHNEGYVRNVAGNDAALQSAAAAFGATALAVNEDHVGTTEYTGGRLSALWQATEALGFNLTYVKQKDTQDDRLFELTQSGAYARSDYQLGEVIGGGDDAQRIDLDILNLTGEYEFGSGTLYASIASMEQDFLRKWDIGSLLTPPGAPLRPIPQVSTTNGEIITQEVRFTSKLDGPFQFVTGLYYEDSEQPTQQPTFFGGDPALNPFAAVKLWQIDLERDVRQKAAYGELSYNATERLKLTVGGRYFDYDTHFVTRTFDSVVIAESNSDLASQESGTTAKAGIQFKPSDATMLYANWSQGFRLGRPLARDLIQAVCDLNLDGLVDGTDIPSTLERIDSDSLDNYELGAKLALRGGRTVLSMAVYQNDWSDIPVAFNAPGCAVTLTDNVGEARARGFETEASFKLFDAAKLTLGVGYVDSELTSTPTFGAAAFGRAGDELNYTPKLNGNLGFEIGFSLAQRRGYVRGDYSYFGSYHTQTGGRGLRADGYDLVSIHAGFALTDRSELLLQIDNALNADDFTSVLGPSGFPAGFAVRVRPRTVGLGLTYRF